MDDEKKQNKETRPSYEKRYDKQITINWTKRKLANTISIPTLDRFNDCWLR